MARPRGVEPLTPRSVVWCSIQLSYGRLCLAAASLAGGWGGNNYSSPPAKASRTAKVERDGLTGAVDLLRWGGKGASAREKHDGRHGDDDGGAGRRGGSRRTGAAARRPLAPRPASPRRG